MTVTAMQREVPALTYFRQTLETWLRDNDFAVQIRQTVSS